MQPPRPSISIFDPLVIGSEFLDRVDAPSRYSHTTKAAGGYWSASFTYSSDVLAMESWLPALGRHVEVYDDALDICWEGFVNKVTLSYGALTVTRGPLNQIANRIDVVHSGIDVTTLPPTVGVRNIIANTPGGAGNDTDSQDLYGIWHEVLTLGAVSATDATQIRDAYLQDNAMPATSKDWSRARQGAPSISVDCLGYVHWLRYPYNQTVATGTVNTNVLILAVIAANPNIADIAFDVTGVETPAAPATILQYEDANRLATDVISDCVVRGDTNYARWLFGIYENLEARYYQAPTTLEYQQRLRDPAQRVTTVTGAEVKPWNVLPGKWLLYPDFLVGMTTPTDLRDDPRAMFIESVTYSAPDQLSLQGGKVDELSQLVGQLGVSGVSS